MTCTLLIRSEAFQLVFKLPVCRLSLAFCLLQALNRCRYTSLRGLPVSKQQCRGKWRWCWARDRHCWSLRSCCHFDTFAPFCTEVSGGWYAFNRSWFVWHSSGQGGQNLRALRQRNTLPVMLGIRTLLRWHPSF